MTNRAGDLYFSDEDHREHLLRLLKRLYRELIVYRAFVEFVKGISPETDVEQMLESARHDPDMSQAKIDEYFQTLSLATPQDLNDELDRAICQYLWQSKPPGKAN